MVFGMLLTKLETALPRAWKREGKSLRSSPTPPKSPSGRAGQFQRVVLRCLGDLEAIPLLASIHSVYT